MTGIKNKPRLYLAYYYRGGGLQDEKYHVAILVRPHPLVEDEKTSMRYHAVNKIVPEEGDTPARVRWIYEVGAVQAHTFRLAGLLYLGKLPAGKTFEDVNAVCAGVPVVNDDECWRCTNWVWTALEVRHELQQ